jgi:hypothetical protein
LTFTVLGATNTQGYRLDDILITSGDAPILSDNNDLATLTVSAGTLDPEFDPEVTTYSVVLPTGTTTVPSVQYTLADAAASAVKTDATSIPGSTTIAVTAENSDKKTYTVNFSATPPAGEWIETFETGPSKTSYNYGEYQGTAALWGAAAVIANNDNSDKKNGLYSARLRDPRPNYDAAHYIEMKQDKGNGAGVISLYHGMYGTHTGGTYKLEVSNNGGSTWNAFVAEVEEVPATLTKISFTANVPGDIRIKITKTNSANNSSINIDDISITNYPGTGMSQIGNDLSVYTTNSTLHVVGYDGKSPVTVYDLTGKLIQRAYSSDIVLPAKGIYIIKVNTQVLKVANK